MSRDARDKWDFFISYTQADRAWAEWIAWILEENGHPVLIQAWDFQPGSHWIQRMQDGLLNADRMISVMSKDYLESVYGSAEWQAFWASDPRGADRRLLVARVAECDRAGLLAGVVDVDLFGLTESAARDRLTKMVSDAPTGGKPADPPKFPGGSRAMPKQPRFPGPRLAPETDEHVASDSEPSASAGVWPGAPPFYRAYFPALRAALGGLRSRQHSRRR